MDMKISDIRLNEVSPLSQNSDKGTANEFEFALNKVSDDDLIQKLNNRIDEIALKGKLLAEHMDISDLREYKGMITEFINDVVTNSHKFSRENFLDRRGRHRVYGIVKLVNKEVDELAQEMLKNESNHLAILEKTDNIRGLLLDIVA